MYPEYMAVLATLLLQVKGKILWRTPVIGTVAGNQAIDEALENLGGGTCRPASMPDLLNGGN